MRASRKLHSATIGGRITEAYKAAGLSRHRLSQITQLAYTTINHWEKHRTTPELSSLQLVAEATGVTVSDLLGDDDLSMASGGNGDPELGLRIAALRERHVTSSGKRLTQDQLARAINVQGMAVSRWERGVHMPGPQHLEALANFFGVTIDEIQRGPRTPEASSSKPELRQIPVIQQMLATWPEHHRPPDDEEIAWLASSAKFHRMTPVGLMMTLIASRAGMLPADEVE